MKTLVLLTCLSCLPLFGCKLVSGDADTNAVQDKTTGAMIKSVVFELDKGKGLRACSYELGKNQIGTSALLKPITSRPAIVDNQLENKIQVTGGVLTGLGVSGTLLCLALEPCGVVAGAAAMIVSIVGGTAVGIGQTIGTTNDKTKAAVSAAGSTNVNRVSQKEYFSIRESLVKANLDNSRKCKPIPANQIE